MTKPALGAQGRAALREPAPIRLVSPAPPPRTGAKYPCPKPAWTVGDPAQVRPLLESRIRAQAARIRELEADLQAARRELDAAREDGARAERMRQAKTHGGRLPSIWGGR